MDRARIHEGIRRMRFIGGNAAASGRFDARVAAWRWTWWVTMDDATSGLYSLFLVDQGGTASSLRGCVTLSRRTGCSVRSTRPRRRPTSSRCRRASPASAPRSDAARLPLVLSRSPRQLASPAFGALRAGTPSTPIIPSMGDGGHLGSLHSRRDRTMGSPDDLFKIVRQSGQRPEHRPNLA